jgi:hypothetical protein
MQETADVAVYENSTTRGGPQRDGPNFLITPLTLICDDVRVTARAVPGGGARISSMSPRWA